MRIETEQVYNLVKKYGGVLTDDRHFMDDVDHILETAHNSDYAKCQKLISMMVGAFGIQGIDNDLPSVRLEYCLHRLQESRAILRQLNKHFA